MLIFLVQFADVNFTKASDKIRVHGYPGLDDVEFEKPFSMGDPEKDTNT